MTAFRHLLANNLVANITNFTVWFAVTFWVFLETRSVFATGMIAGFYLVLTAGLGFWLGSLVDHHRKKRVMLGSSMASFALYGLSLAAHELAPEGALADVSGKHIYEAMATGPQNMPVFSDSNITPEGKRDIITFLKQIESSGSPGGAALGSLGPVAEGLFVWVAGLGVIIAFTIWLTSRTS